MEQTIKIKDTGYVGKLMFAVCTFPIFFMLLLHGLKLGYLLTFIIIGSVYVIAFIYFIKFLKKNENKFEIVANNESITFEDNTFYKWNEIIKIETYAEKLPGHGRTKMFIKFSFENGQKKVLDASNYDIHYEDLKNQLNHLKAKSIEQQTK